MYKELKTKRKLGDDVVEVGAVSLPKTANSRPSNFYIGGAKIFCYLKGVI